LRIGIHAYLKVHGVADKLVVPSLLVLDRHWVSSAVTMGQRQRLKPLPLLLLQPLLHKA
jgi:hypothetical protein